MFSLSLRRLKGAFGSAGSGGSEKSGFRPRLELLETRTVPSGGPITVIPPLNQLSVEGHTQLFSLGGFTQNPTDGPWSVSVDWNDGTTSSFNTGLAGGVPPQFLPPLPHRYVEESNGHAPNADGTYHVSVTVTDKDADKTGTGTFNIKVTDPSVVGTGVVFQSRPDLSDSQVVAHFTDPGGPEFVTTDTITPQVPDGTDYLAKINWGDGSTSTGAISFNSMTHQFDVISDHTYETTHSNVYIIKVTICHELSLPTTVFSSAVIIPAIIPFSGLATGPGNKSGVDTSVSDVGAVTSVSTGTTVTNADSQIHTSTAVASMTMTHTTAVSASAPELNANLGTWEAKSL